MDFSFYGLISFFVNGFDILLLFHMNYSLNVAHRVGLFLLRLLVQPVDNVQQGVARRDVAPRLGAALGVDGAANVGEIAEEVETVEHTDKIAVEETLGEAGVPDKFVGVHCVVGVATAGVHGEVGGELEAPRQFDLGGEAVVEVEDVDGLEVCAVAGGVLVVEVADALDVHFGIRAIGQAQRLVGIVGADDAARGGYGGGADEVDAVLVVESGIRRE